MQLRQVGHYLWGIDTPKILILSFIISCRTLPMRNWHPIISLKYYITNLSDITYEELTPNTFMPGLSQLRCLAPVGHYLWGIDTMMHIWQLCPKYGRIFSVGHYLWGIDTSSPTSTASAVAVSVSDITYEELTPIITDILSPFSFLPFWICRTLPMRNWHKDWNSITFFFNESDITYEELTQTNLLSDRFPTYSRRTLPMRNWHI